MALVSSLAWALQHSSLCSDIWLPEGLCTCVPPTVAPSVLHFCACMPCARHPKAVSHLQRACNAMIRIVPLSPQLQRRLVCSSGILHSFAMGSGTVDTKSSLCPPGGSPAVAACCPAWEIRAAGGVRQHQCFADGGRCCELTALGHAAGHIRLLPMCLQVWSSLRWGKGLVLL